MIGVAAAFPRRFYFRGEAVRGYVLGDFCIDPAHRSLGLALALQRACLERLVQRGYRFCVGFSQPDDVGDIQTATNRNQRLP